MFNSNLLIKKYLLVLILLLWKNIPSSSDFIEVSNSQKWFPLHDIAKVTVANEFQEENKDEVKSRQPRHFSTMDACQDAICDQVLRQAQGLSRLKLLRQYAKDTVNFK